MYVNFRLQLYIREREREKRERKREKEREIEKERERERNKERDREREIEIEPIALYASEVWGALAKQDFTKWDKHPIKTLHAEFCKILLHVQRKTTNNACRAESGQYPLIIKTQKKSN